MKDAIVASEKALSMYSNNKTFIPLRTNIRDEKNNGEVLYMSGNTFGEVESSGLKIVSVYPDNAKNNLPVVPATMVLVDSKTGVVCSILDGTYLTALRTAALQGLATKMLSNEDAKVATIIGAGGQSFMQVVAMIEVRKLEKLYIFNFNKERANKLKEKIENYLKEYKDNYNLEIVISNNVDEAVSKSDIVTTVTTSKTPTFNFNYVKKGTHINGIGSYTKEMIELPEELIINADKIYFDTSDGVLSEAGDIINPLKNGKMMKVNLQEN
ncbi:putative ornithine cyclodeaminase [Gemelliphila asaccharolytica]|uniref:Ornithine cyclodeaminase n=2 Tax=Gemelliphila asaccharolytica TaxID=502393 RepID=A0ABR5TL67_9BACL|nr:putative ornithine cyclodeaminase [Gemella asaccharolytica]